MKMQNVQLQYLVLLGTLAYCLACRCLPTSYKEKYCAADFVAAVYIRDRRVVGSEQIYDVNLLKMYSKKPFGVRVDRNHLYSGTHSCGISLQTGKYYIVTGSIMDGGRRPGKLTTMLCSQIQKQFNYNPIRTYRPPRCQRRQYGRNQRTRGIAGSN